MADIGELLGTVMAGLARARQMADEETAAIAEEYRGNPLLDGITVPRIRVPEMTVEIPVVIEEYEGGNRAKLANPSGFVTGLYNELKVVAKQKKITIPATVSAAFKRELTLRADKFQSEVGVGRTASREAVSSMVAESLNKPVLEIATRTPVTAAQKKILYAALQKKALELAQLSEAQAPRLKATILTNEVKERSGPENVTRLKITLREEGLEWTVDTHEDGSVTRRLTPE
jgi:hypothetical protein